MSKVDSLISLTEAVELTGRARLTIIRWVDRGEVVGKKVGNTYVVDKDSLLEHHNSKK